ncbi:MAG: hypothetical protein ACREKN_08055 [Longimicrobiaceae bacterium]
MAALVGLAVLTAWLFGAAGIIYYLARKEHQVCPRCGLNWGEGARRVAAARLDREVAGVPSQGKERARRTTGWLLAALALLFLYVGVAGEVDYAALVMATVSAALAYGSYRAALRERKSRRDALLAAFQRPVLRLAARNGGLLTVSEVAAVLNWPLTRADKVLTSLDDGVRVDSEVTDRGVIVYRFRELPPAPRE